MAQNLPNTGVTVWNDTTDAQGDFQSWYNMIAGLTNSNMVKLDNSVGNKASFESTELTLLNGWQIYVGSNKISKCGNIVVLPPIRINNGTTTQGTLLFTLPVGFRPPSTIHATAFWDNTKPTLLTIGGNGNVSILYSDAPTSSSSLAYNIVFYV